LGILDAFKKKKEPEEDMFSQPNFPPQQPNNEFQYQQQDQGYGSQDPFGQQPNQGFGQDPMGQNKQQPYSPEQDGFERVKERDSYPSRHNNSVSDINLGKDMELINAKLDAIKSELDSINQRIKRIERMSEGAGTATKKDPWY
jgi:hypothetical protein